MADKKVNSRNSFSKLTPGEAEFTELMRVIFRRSGRRDAWRLLNQMIDESDDGAFRGDLLAKARAVVASLPTLNELAPTN